MFQKIYERKLEIISLLYARSIEAGRAAKYAVEMHGYVPEERVPELENDVRKFKEQYEIARLWLDDECCKVIDRLVGEQSVFYKVVNAANMEKSGLGKDWIGGKYVDLWERAQNQLPVAQEKLRQTFQATMKEIEP